jgi:23S rRNA (cytosine1962-C5)-methyltransferase
MKNYPRILLKPGKDAAVRRFHPWIFSGAILRMVGKPHPGSIVEVFTADDQYLATGHYYSGSISVKIFSFQQRPVDYAFWREKIFGAYRFRESLNLTAMGSTNAYRLVYSESDGMPGLIIDYYNGIAVLQVHSAGMSELCPVFTDILKELYQEKLTAVYRKSAEAAQGRPEETGDGFLFGSAEQALISETGHPFKVDFINGQKTGFFLDQRANRMFAQFYARNRNVLNAFCYSGAFSVYALKGGANHVHSVDSSRQAIGWTKENIALNGIPDGCHSEQVADVKNLLPGITNLYDMIILDPPAFAKHHTLTHNALQAYIHINAEAMKKMTDGGILFTFSCSQAISREMFRSAVQSAAIESGKDVRVIHTLSQGSDHPVSIYHPEGEYLKGLIVKVSKHY